MDFNSRLAKLETAFPPPTEVTDEALVEFVETQSANLRLGILVPPLTDEAREALMAFVLNTFCCEGGFRVAGYSAFQLQESLRRSAADAGLIVSDTFEAAAVGRAEDQIFLGPYRREGGMEYRQRLQAERKQQMGEHRFYPHPLFKEI